MMKTKTERSKPSIPDRMPPFTIRIVMREKVGARSSLSPEQLETMRNNLKHQFSGLPHLDS
ncbi:MAG: hypothetical protein KAI66_27085 [Lentisphaeria bacterium]|nr:hypothetical protein [Lentisphaeria bacterium]